MSEHSAIEQPASNTPPLSKNGILMRLLVIIVGLVIIGFITEYVHMNDDEVIVDALETVGFANIEKLSAAPYVAEGEYTCPSSTDEVRTFRMTKPDDTSQAYGVTMCVGDKITVAPESIDESG